jgi:hypothetical protein
VIPAKETVFHRPNPIVEKTNDGFAAVVMFAVLNLRDREEETYQSVIVWLFVDDDVRRQHILTLTIRRSHHYSEGIR